jgi:dihydroneopterin aldolase/2-amino-4-hydroxy-6-hydroxymethyldihydropteridine diphosphokinase
MTRVFIGVGSNIDPEENIRRAIALIKEKACITGVSSFYLTEPLGGPGQDRYYNGVLEIETDIKPVELKRGLLRGIEERLGRVRTQDADGPRTIDLDILLYNDIVFDGEGLKLPSPEILERAFVAVPLSELAPEVVLPGSGVRLKEVAERFKADAMVKLAGFTKEMAGLAEERERR